MTSPRIAIMAEPAEEDAIRAAIVLVHAARDRLSETERRLSEMERHATAGPADNTFKTMQMTDAADLLKAAHTLLGVLSVFKSDHLIDRAIAACAAAAALGQVYDTYRTDTPTDQAPWEAETERRALSRWRKACAAAKTEAHRALAGICEAFPSAVTVDRDAEDGSKSFLDRVLAGEIADPATAIGDAIETWHVDKRAEGELHEYLGMTWEEYTEFVAKPSALAEIIAARARKSQPQRRGG